MRILGLDYGSKRIGLAVCDELGLTAYGIATLVRKNKRQVIDDLRGVIEKYNVEKIVIGYPLRLDGTRGTQCEIVDKFSSILEAEFAIPVIKWDEVLTTKEAKEVLVEVGSRRKKRQNKIDQTAASVILKDYLNFLRRDKSL